MMHATYSPDDNKLLRENQSDALTEDVQSHTPGPWRVTRDNPHTSEIAYIRAAARDEVATIYCAKDDCDARLIAAAPDLLAALSRFVSAAKSWHNFHHGSASVQCDLLCEAIAPGEAAIAKAEGRL